MPKRINLKTGYQYPRTHVTMISDAPELDSLKKYAFAVYILQALSFVTLITAVIGIIIDYIKDDDARGSWLETHFRWQKLTFWYGLLWTLLGVLTTPIYLGYAVLGFVTIWLMYRITRGWIYLVDGKPMYLDTGVRE